MNSKFLNMRDTISNFKNETKNMMLNDLISMQSMYNKYMFEYNIRKQDSLELAIMKNDWDLREQKFDKMILNTKLLALAFCIIVVFLR